MTKLSVNVNKVATLRNTRALAYPSPAEFAARAIDAGAHGITIHPRPDERHIRPADVEEIAKLTRDRGVEFNIEGNPFEGRFVDYIETYLPTQATLVPDSPGQSTSDHGWTIRGNEAVLGALIQRLKRSGTRVSVFMDYDSQEIDALSDLGADRIELYTEPYASAFERGDQSIIQQFNAAAQTAASTGLRVNAGHDLTLANLPALLAGVDSIAEVSIGHALVADALLMGVSEVVKRYVAACITL